MGTPVEPRNDLIELIETISELTPEAIPAPEVLVKTLYRATGKQEHLLSKTRSEQVALKNGKITLKFASPVWIYDVTFWSGSDKAADAERLAQHTFLTITDPMGRVRNIQHTVSNSFIFSFPRCFAAEITIEFKRISKLGAFTPKCRNIQVIGLAEKDFGDFCNSAMKYIQDSKKFAAAKDEMVLALEKTVADISNNDLLLQSSVEALEQSQAELAAENETLTRTRLEITKADTQLSIISNSDAELRQRISENEQANKSLVQDIQLNKKALDKLQADKNIFMEEYGSYVEQGARNILSYFAIAAVMIIIASICLWRLIASAASLAGDPTILKDISAFDLFLSRAPLALALAFVAALCLRVIGTLLGKIFEIHQERLLLSKLSILAKDNSFASAEGLDVAPDLIYSQRISLKMELLKEFLAGNYRSAQAKESVLRERFTEFLQRNRKPERDDIEPDIDRP